MRQPRISSMAEIPGGLRPHFQDYDISQLNFANDANLIIQRTLEFGSWEETRWLFELYGAQRIRLFVREHGQRWLKPVTFHYWRKLLDIRQWKSSPFPTAKGEVWNH